MIGKAILFLQSYLNGYTKVFHLIEQLTVLESIHKMLTTFLLLIVTLVPNLNKGMKKKLHLK